MNFLKNLSEAFTCAAMSVSPDTGNTASSTYIIVLVIAGVLIIGAVAAGIISKKKK